MGLNRTHYLWINIIVLLNFNQAVAQISGQQPKINKQRTSVRALTVENGLPQGYVNGIVQDSTGFIWLSTRDGLARYDGYNVKTFHYDPEDSSSIASDVIQTIYLDRQNQLWILYDNFSVDVFDPVTGEVQHVQASGPQGWLLKNRKNRPFLLKQDSHGKYWYVSPSLRQICYFTKRQPKPVEIPNPRKERIVAIQEGSDGKMYVCTKNSFYLIKDGRLHKIADLPYPRKIVNDRISQMVQDTHGNWVIMNGGYLEIFTPSGIWQVANASNISYPSDNYFVVQAPDGGIYFNSGNQVFRLNANLSLSLVWTNTNNPTNIPTMMIDRSNVLWAGTNTFGARFINLSSSGFSSYPYKDGFTNDMLAQWFGIPAPKNYKQGDNTYQLRFAKNMKGECWILGASFIQPESSKEKPHLQPFKLAKQFYAPAPYQSNSLRWLQFDFDKSNKCWALVLDKNSDTLLIKANLQTGSISQVQSWKCNFGDIGYLSAFNNKLCFVDYNKGVEIFEPKSGKSTIYSSKEVFGNVKLLMAQPDLSDPNVLWITSLGYGLIKFNTANGKMEAFTVKEGIPSNSVYAAIFDDNGNLWCSSNKGIFRFNPSSRKVLSFVASDGLQGNEFNRFHFLESPDGHIFFGGTLGWTVFHPDSIYIDAYQPATAITQILVNNAPLTQLKTWKDSIVTALEVLPLNYDQNFITFNFAGLQFSNPEKLKYRYQLVNFDEKWVEVGNQHTANYTNLPPGKYTFKVNSSNEAGIWSNYVKSLPIIIHPPWWKTWWAYTLYAILILYFGYFFYRSRIKQHQIKQQIILHEIKTRFFSNITHEFRTPLSLIIAPLEQINNETETPLSIKKKVRDIQHNAQQLLSLINQLLDMSKIEAGSMGTSLSRGNLGLFIEDILKGFKAAIKAKKIKLSFDCSLQGEHNFDADKWRKIFFNLISNAVKFSPIGGRIAVRLLADDKNSLLQTIILEVKDSGIGIPSDQLTLIFNRFYQVDDSQTRTHSGTGIGLALAKELTELMNGVIEVKSEPGKGALFRVSIPVEKSPNIESPLLEKFPFNISYDVNEEKVNEQVPLLGKDAPLILLVEDNEDLNRFISLTLGKKYRIITAFNGKEGLLMAKQNLPDLIISDIMMPKMDGFTLCEALKESVATNHIAIVLLSAKTSHDSISKGLKNHADDYITKPFHVDELLLRINNLIERQQKLRNYYNKQLTNPIEQLNPKTMPNLFIRHLYTIIDEHLDDTQLDVGKLATKMAVTRRTLNRKLSMLVNLSASEVIRQYRLKKSVVLLRSGLNVSETAYRVGFTSVSYFSNSYKVFYGVSPSETKFID